MKALDALASSLVAVLLTGCGSEAPQTAADLAAQFPVELGQGVKYRSYAKYPVMAQNLSGREVLFLKVSCAFYDQKGSFIATGVEGWPNVPVGGRMSGHVSVETKNADHYECSASPTY